MKPLTCTGSRRGCAFCVEVVRLLYRVSNAAARTVVYGVGRQVSPSFGLTASSFVNGLSMLSKLTPAVTARDGVTLKVSIRV